MRTSASLFAVGLGAVAIGILSIAFAQNNESPEAAVERRLTELELSFITLNNLVRTRTDVVGIEDRTNRDFNVETRFRELEQQLQQLQFSVSDMQRQASDAMRIASQAQSDAQLAQQIARDAQARVQ